MKTPALLMVFAAAVAASLARADSVARPPHSIAGSELRVLPTNAHGRTYQLHVHLPGSYASHPERRYPVLYLTDAYWDFPTVVASCNNLAYDRTVPEIIVVGLGYAGTDLDFEKLRGWELTPVPLRPDDTETGHAAEFLTSLEQDIIPFVEREYRADPAQRALAGSSFGGLFALYAMYSRPALFQGIIAASPAVVVGNDWLLDYARAFARLGARIDARLYVTGASDEWPDFLAGIQRYQKLLVEFAHPGLIYENRTIDGMRHAGTKPESYARGLQFIYAPLAAPH